VALYRPGDEAELCQLQTFLWSADVELNRRYLEWKYERNPYLPDPILVVARHRGQLVAARGMFGSCWSVGPARRRAVLPVSSDMVIHPQHRRAGGLFGRMTSLALATCRERGHEYAINLSANRLSAVSLRMLGWRSIGPLAPVRRYGASPAAMARKLALGVPPIREWWNRRALRPTERVPPAGAPDAGAFAALDRARLDPPASVATEPRPEQMAACAARLRDDRIAHLPDAAFYRWRFQNPLAAYRFLFWGDERLEGFLVLQAAGSRRATLVDWSAESAHVLASLLALAARAGRFEHLTTWAPSEGRDERAFREAGFAQLHRGPDEEKVASTMFVRRLADPEQPWELEGRALLDPASWDLRMIDSDGE
jgi:hypothetical protein